MSKAASIRRPDSVWVLSMRLTLTSRLSSGGGHQFFVMKQNRRGRPLTSYEEIVTLIANTTTETGLTVKAVLGSKKYETGGEVSDEQLARVKLTRVRFHVDWNYAIRPRRKLLNLLFRGS